MDVSPSALFGAAPSTSARDAPLAIFVCGCNGAGKSTLIAAARQDAAIAALPLFDPDLLAREHTLPPLAAGKQAIALTREALAACRPFIRESTLTAQLDFALMAEAKRRGFHTRLLYVGVLNADMAIARVQERVAQGGHDIAEGIIRRRFPKSIAHLARALALCDDATLLDNSGASHQMFARFANGEAVYYALCPPWFMPVHKHLALRFTGIYD